MFSSASDRFGKTIDSETTLLAAFVNNIQGSIDFSLMLADAAEKLLSDIANILSRGISGKAVGIIHKAYGYNVDYAAKWGNIARYAKAGTVFAKCANGLQYVYRSNNLDAGYYDNIIEAVSDCIDASVKVVSDVNTVIKNSKNASDFLKLQNSLQVMTFGVIVDGGDKDKHMAALKVSIDILEAIKDIASTVGSPSVSIFSSCVDIFVQAVKISIAADQFFGKASENQDANVKAAIQLFDVETKKIINDYYIGYLSIYNEYFIVVDSSGTNVFNGRAINQGNGVYIVELIGIFDGINNYEASFSGSACSSVAGWSSEKIVFNCRQNASISEVDFSLKVNGKKSLALLRNFLCRAMLNVFCQRLIHLVCA